MLKNREIGLFCNISATTLNDPQYFPQMVQFMEANRALAPSLVLEFKQSAWRDMGPLELESLAALRELGFRFCMDQVTDLRIEPRDLAERGVRFVKVPAALLLGRAEHGSDIHAADLSDLLHRHGISLIADKIEAENQVVDLLDYDLRFGQGFLFSPPRPVRAEALQALPERTRPPSAATAPPTSRGPPRSDAHAGRSSLALCPPRRPFIERFATLAAGYDAVLSDVWGVIHNGVAATPDGLRRADALSRQGRHRGADHQRAAAGRGGDASFSTSSACRATPMTPSSAPATSPAR